MQYMTVKTLTFAVAIIVGTQLVQPNSANAGDYYKRTPGLNVGGSVGKTGAIGPMYAPRTHSKALPSNNWNLTNQFNGYTRSNPNKAGVIAPMYIPKSK